jgi:translocation and assembly module TamA
VNIDSGERDNEHHTVRVTIEAKRNRRNKYSASLGYATDTRARGKLNWDDRYVNDRGHRAGVELIASQPLESIVGRYTIPVRDVALEKLEFTLASKQEELADLTSKRNEFTTSLTQIMGRWQRVLFVRLSRETTIEPNPLMPAVDSSSTQFLVVPGISYSTYPNQLLNEQPLRYSLYGELSGAAQTLGSDASFLRLLLQGERIFDLNRRWHLRLRAQFGTIWTNNFDGVPASERFFAGGDNSVRGFALNELSPLDQAGSKVGGKNLVVGTVELERNLKWPNFRAAVFTDAGNAFDRFGDGFAYSAGVGLRYNIAVASLGIDLAQPLYAPNQSVSGRLPRLHLHISTLF